MADVHTLVLKLKTQTPLPGRFLWLWGSVLDQSLLILGVHLCLLPAQWSVCVALLILYIFVCTDACGMLSLEISLKEEPAL